jgi:hypothetical protein
MNIDAINKCYYVNLIAKQKEKQKNEIKTQIKDITVTIENNLPLPPKLYNPVNSKNYKF